MTNKLLFGLLSIMLMTSCGQQTIIDNKVKGTNDFDIVINHPDTIRQEQEMFATIHISNTKYKLMHASVKCNISDTSTVDTLRGRVLNCNHSLTVENDSVKIWMQTGKGVGRINFEDITLLAKGADNKYYYQKCTFDYYVK